MKNILITGIGAGDPDFVAMQAVKVLKAVDCFFILKMGAARDGMMDLRRESFRCQAGDCAHQIFEVPSRPHTSRTASTISSRPSWTPSSRQSPMGGARGSRSQITTGRRPAGVDTVVVMLVGEEACRRFTDQDNDIDWGV